MSVTNKSINERQASTGGGATRFYGTVDEPALVTINGERATLAADNTYEGFLSLTEGNHDVTIEATDADGNVSSQDFNVNITSPLPVTYTYDAEGNTSTKTENGVVTTYQWDAENRLVSITSGNQISEFTYNGLGQRVQIIEKNGSTIASDKRFLWCGSKICEERNAANQPTRHYYGEGEIRTAHDPAPGTYYYTTDHLGSTTGVLDATGAVVARYDYSPYGQVTQSEGSLQFDMLYTGHYRHESSGLYLTLYRAYDSSQGRWLSPDPLEQVTGELAELLPEGSNIYAYVGNNPINAIDPLGLDMWCDSSGGAHTSVYVSDPTSKTGVTLYSFAQAHGRGRNASLLSHLRTNGMLTVNRNVPKPVASSSIVHIPTTPEQDARARNRANQIEKKPGKYGAANRNCSDVAKNIMEAGLGVPIKGPRPTTPDSLNRSLQFMLRWRSQYGF